MKGCYRNLCPFMFLPGDKKFFIMFVKFEMDDSLKVRH